MKNKKGAKGVVSLVLAIGLIVVALVLALNYRSLKSDQKDTLSVTGSAEKSVAPDEVEMYLVIETTDPTAKQSQANNSGISNSVLKSLKDLGITAADIETDSYTIYPKEIYDEKNGVYKLVGYTVTNTLKVTTKDIDNVGKYIDGAVQAGANRIDRIVFGLTIEKEAQVRNDLIKLAGANAKQKATDIANNMNVPLGKIVTISESNINIAPVPIYFGKAEGGVSMDSSSISPKNIDTSAYISVVYEI
jgi:uncharacterized protein YggE